MTANMPKADVSPLSLARILQFGDSAFPIGAFSFSNGLESAIQTGIVKCIDTLREFTLTALEQSVRGDTIALICAHRAAGEADMDRLAEIDQAVMARKVSEEARTMTTRMGKKLVELSTTFVSSELILNWRNRIEAQETPGSYAVALALVFAAQGFPVRSTFVVHQYGVAAAILSAALRLLKVSHIDTQKILYDVNEIAEASFEGVADAKLSDMSGFAPVLDILTAVHTKSHVRLFMN